MRRQPSGSTFNPQLQRRLFAGARSLNGVPVLDAFGPNWDAIQLLLPSDFVSNTLLLITPAMAVKKAIRLVHYHHKSTSELTGKVVSHTFTHPTKLSKSRHEHAC